MIRSDIPQPIAIKTAILKGKIKIGIAKLKIKPETERKVKRVVSQISFVVCLAFPFSSSDSSDICNPAASAKPSAVAIIIIPATTANLEDVAEYKPTIIPRAVITPEVKPKEMPVVN